MVVLVLNPTAARGKAARVWPRIRDELRDWQTMPTVVETERAGHAAEIAREAAISGSSLVIAAGGDGTAHEVVQGLMEVDAGATGTAFGHLPLGTGCDLARSLGLSRRPDGILKQLRDGRDAFIDVGVAEMSNGEETIRRFFLNACTVGLGPAVARRVSRSRGLQRLGTRAYSLAAIREIFSGRAHRVSWSTDAGASGETSILHLFANNGPSVAGGMQPSPAARLDDGLLHVVMVGPLGIVRALIEFRRLEARKPFKHPDIRAFTCRSLELEGADLEVETDGEIAGGLPARLSVRPGGLLVRLPG